MSIAHAAQGWPRRCVICGEGMADGWWPENWIILFDHGWYCPAHRDSALLLARSIDANIVETMTIDEVHAIEAANGWNPR